MSREVEVIANEYPDAKFSGHTVKITLKHNRGQWSSMTFSPAEAEVLRDALTEYLDTTREDQAHD